MESEIESAQQDNAIVVWVHLINLLNSKLAMIETPIRRKQTNYPKDFIPNPQKTAHPKRFTFHPDYQIEVNSIKKYEKDIEEHPHPENTPLDSTQAINPEISLLAKEELQQQSPLLHHSTAKKPNLDEQLLKKPKFTMLDKAELNEGQSSWLQKSMSPGCIRKQLENRQPPLPISDPCRIDLVISNNQINKFSSSIIKYKSSGQFMANKWKSTEKDIVNNFQGTRSRIESVTHLPKVSKQSPPDVEMVQSAKQQYERFRKRQQSLGNSFSNVSNLITSLHKKEGNKVTELPLPQFEPSAIQKLKQEINKLAKNKVGRRKKDCEESSQEQSEESTVRENKKDKLLATYGQKMHEELRKPELLVSYRSSLSYLKDLQSKAAQLGCYHLVVKIPKIFTQKLIFRQQQKQELYQAARAIFQQLRIECENLVIKRYTNCTMIVARNICLIWHFDGKRYLGGWQSEYLDQGLKHGLGLEWEPKKYVYYGEFVKNKKHGLGIYKDSNEISYVGYWKNGKKASQSELCQSDNEQQENSLRQQTEQEQDVGSSESRAFQYV